MFLETFAIAVALMLLFTLVILTLIIVHMLREVITRMPVTDRDPARAVITPPDEDTLIEPPAAVAGDSVKQWLQHYTYGQHTWADAVAEFYRRAAADPEIADYFTGVDMERLQRHFTAAIIMVTGKGLRTSTIEAMRTAHARIRNRQGQPITGAIYDRVIMVLVTILVEWQVPPEAITDLARIIAPLRAAVVVIEQPIWPYDIPTPK